MSQDSILRDPIKKTETLSPWYSGEICRKYQAIDNEPNLGQGNFLCSYIVENSIFLMCLVWLNKEIQIFVFV